MESLSSGMSSTLTRIRPGGRAGLEFEKARPQDRPQQDRQRPKIGVGSQTNGRDSGSFQQRPAALQAFRLRDQANSAHFRGQYDWKHGSAPVIYTDVCALRRKCKNCVCNPIYHVEICSLV